MAQTVTCTGCGNVLRVADDIQLTWLTCPRCLALVSKPEAKTRVAPLDAIADVLPVEPAAPPVACPRCGQAVEADFRVCPRCAESLRPGPIRRPLRTADADVSGDLSLIGAGFILLGILGAIGVVVFLMGGGLEQAFHWNPESLVLVWGILLALPLVGIGFTLTSKRPEKSLLLGLGGGCAFTLVAVGLPLAFVLAAIIAFVNTCAKCGKTAAEQKAVHESPVVGADAVPGSPVAPRE